MILTGDCRDLLQTLPDNSIDCCITSPPYWGLRDYGNIPNQIGLEATLEEYIETIRDVFREVHRVLKPEGTLWLNLGDKYNDKSLLLIPAQVAISLKKDGWILRNDIIWAKTNPIPESVKDRLTCSHEHIFLFTKIETGYYFDAESISESCAASSLKRYAQDIENQSGSFRQPGKSNGPMKAVLPRYNGKKYTENPDVFYRTKSGSAYDPRSRRNKRDVWHLSTARFSGNHFATYPEHLVIPCILAGCPIGGTVLDPFSGSGTTGKVAHDLGRQYIGIELNPAYAEVSEKKIGAHIQIKLSDLSEVRS
jgi:DNA modification methylase